MGYTIKQKIDICLKSESNPEMTQADLAIWAKNQYGSVKAPSQTTISRILSSKNDIIASKETDFQLVRRRKQSNPLLRRILTEWITQASWENIPVTTPIIQLTANAIWNELPNVEKDGNGIFNHKWCNHFIKRLNINLTGDRGDILANPYEYKLNKVWKLDEKLDLKNYLREIIKKENYLPQDIFTIDEFQIFYSLPLDQIFDVSSINKGLKQASFSNENSLTVMLGCNIDGLEKLTPLIVGKHDKFDVSHSSQNSLKNISSSSLSKHNLMNKITETYQISYKSNLNKWITSSMFQKYLLTLEHKLTNSTPQRKILIILDDSSSHRIINVKFKSIKLCYLKNNSANRNPYNSLYNGVKFDYIPMSFGIVEEFKILFRLQQYLEMINLQRMNHKQGSQNLKDDNYSNDSIPKSSSISLTNFETMLDGNTNNNVLSESDYHIPLIKVIEWIKRSWDSISSERIYLSWKRAHIINLTEPWPSSDPFINNLANHSLLKVHSSSLNYNVSKSYEKLVEIMKYLNVVIPWDVDELLGLVNERGKVTLSYASIEEIIGSCLSEDYGLDDIDDPNNFDNNNNTAINRKPDAPYEDAKLVNTNLNGETLNNKTLLVDNTWYDPNDPNHNIINDPLASPSLSSSTTTITSPSGPKSQNPQFKRSLQQPSSTLLPPHDNLNILQKAGLNFADFPNTWNQSTMNITTLLAAADSNVNLSNMDSNLSLNNRGSLNDSPHYPTGSPVTLSNGESNTVITNSHRNKSLTLASQVPQQPQLRKQASTASIDFNRQTQLAGTYDHHVTSSKHKLDDINASEPINNSIKKHQRQLVFSPLTANQNLGFSYVSTSPLNDSLPSTASSPPYTRAGAGTPLNQGVPLLSKAVFSGISYRSKSSSNLVGNKSNESSNVNSPSFNAVANVNPVANVNLVPKGNEDIIGNPYSNKLDDGELMSMLSKLTDNSNSLKLSNNALNELKSQLSELQDKYQSNKLDGNTTFQDSR